MTHNQGGIAAFEKTPKDVSKCLDFLGVSSRIFTSSAVVIIGTWLSRHDTFCYFLHGLLQ